MRTGSSGAKRKAGGPPASEPAISDLEFAGCEAVPMTAAEFEAYDGRLEVWDAETGTAWLVRDVSPAHERPAQGLAGLVERIAAVRGSPIRCYGSMDLLVRDEHGRRRRAMEADQAVYLYPSRANDAEGRAEGEARGRAKTVRAVLQSRGIACSEHLLAGVPDALPDRVVVDAALACDSEQDFHARLRR